MNFELFKQLYSEALEYESLEMYTEERGWQDWMNDYEPRDILTRIYNLANSSIKENREEFNLSRAALSRLTTIPNRTLQDWELDQRTPPSYVKLFIDYALFTGVLYAKSN